MEDHTQQTSKFKKFIVLGILFLLPITAYMFFATGKDNFVRLPIMAQNVTELVEFKTLDDEELQLANRITVLQFLGSEVDGKKANAFNLAHKIYKKNHQFDDFQFVTLITPDQEPQARLLQERLKEIEDPKSWYFGLGSPNAIKTVFQSLQTPYGLNASSASDYVFIIDKSLNLRGRDDDEDVGLLYGFDASDYAEVNNKMSDDIKVVLAEYRLALKKYKADRKDEFRDAHLKN